MTLPASQASEMKQGEDFRLRQSWTGYFNYYCEVMLVTENDSFYLRRRKSDKPANIFRLEHGKII